jgi:hypothetical protein
MERRRRRWRRETAKGEPVAPVMATMMRVGRRGLVVVVVVRVRNWRIARRSELFVPLL